ncbi:hypothetical protein BB559_003932 [Furculomyces boomerangus]|uniref:Nuclear speckle splicing regulatory protein 1 N-terminal domain-containing protein n=1 Tax=Furculomyces boomerangus TaxID=61424 RepID=A0A2T9YHU3_9FUNG|nr:hypothetical protein BB559_003932 [Furculomyces boomerangus]
MKKHSVPGIGLKYGLNVPEKKKTAPKGNISHLFGNDSAERSNGSQEKKLLGNTSTTISKSIFSKLDYDEQDANIYAYDEVYDTMKSKSIVLNEEKDEEEKKPKYIASLMKSAETRKLDLERSKQKLILREREAENGKFGDKEKFVTQAYKDQLETFKRMEEMDRKKESEELSNPHAMASFYSNVLEESEKAKMAAINVKLSTKSTKNNSREQESEDNDIDSKELISAARARGEDVILNIDSQVVDKRQLLVSGLNIPTKKQHYNATSKKSSSSSSRYDQKKQHRYNDENYKNEGRKTDRYKNQSEKHRYENPTSKYNLEKNEIKDTKNLVESDEVKLIEQKLKRKNNEDSISAAKQRYLERKKKQLDGNV